jgi:hypothetical protein
MDDFQIDGYQTLLCAQIVRVIVGHDTTAQLDLRPLAVPLNQARASVLETITADVEQYSGKLLTIREANKALFDEFSPNNPRPETLYLAICPISTSRGTIEQLNKEVFLMVMRPDSPGLVIGAKPALPRKLAAHREYVAKERHYLALVGTHRHRATMSVVGLAAQLVNALGKRIEACQDPTLQQTFKMMDERARGPLDFDKIAIFAAALGLTLQDLMKDPID